MGRVSHGRAGWILIAVGAFFLLQYLLNWGFYWATVLIIIGGVILIHSAIIRNHWGVFPGSLLLLMGLFFLSRETGILEDPMFMLWPMFLIIIGVSFVMVFLFQPREWGMLIPGGILTGIGMLFFLRNYGCISWHAVGSVLRWWPIALIAVGAWMVLGRSRRRE